MFRRTASLAALAAILLSSPAPARPPGGGGHGGGRGFGGGRPVGGPVFRPSFTPSRVVIPSGQRSFYYSPGLSGRTATSFPLRLAQNPFRARNLFFFGQTSPFGLSGGWLRHRHHAFPWFAFGYGLGYGLPLGYASDFSAYAPDYAPPIAPPGTDLPAEIEPPSESLGRAIDYAQRGEIDFHNGQYDEAVRNWRHALVDQPNNGGLVLLLGQGLFQTANFAEAAGVVQHGLAMLPQDQWGVVVGKYARLYGSTGDYTAALRTLEKARNDNPRDPALRFLLGYHYAYLGYPKEAMRELVELVKLAPGDAIARKIRDAAAAKLKPGS
jgi:tetratricopeptide (TPR) repeat protein